MKTIVPLDESCQDIHDELVAMFCRIANEATKRHNNLDITVCRAARNLIIAFDNFYNDKISSEQLVQKLKQNFEKDPNERPRKGRIK